MRELEKLINVRSGGPREVQASGTNFDLSTGQLSRKVPTGISLCRCRIGRRKCMLRPGIWLDHFYDGEVAWNCILPTLVHPIELYFLPLLDKESGNFLPRSPNPAFQCPSRRVKGSDSRKALFKMDTYICMDQQRTFLQVLVTYWLPEVLSDA